MELDEIKSAAENATKKFETAMNAWETVKSEVLPLGKKFEELDADTKAKLVKCDKAISDANEMSQKAAAQAKAAEEKAKEQETQLKALEIAFNRVPNGGDGKSSQAKAEEIAALHKKAVNEFARHGGKNEYFDEYVARRAAEEPEFKALSVGSDPNGGYLVQNELGGVLKTKVFESSPVRMLASSVTISTNGYEAVVRTDKASAGWVSESGSRSATGTPSFGKVDIPVHEMYANAAATQTSLDDAVIDLEALLSEEITDEFMRVEATAFVSGNGVGKPRGLLSYTAGTDVALGQIEQVATRSASTFTDEGIIRLQNSLKEPYQRNAVFLIQRASNIDLMLIKDGQGRPIFNFQYERNVGEPPASLMGRPLYFAADMPAVAANNLAMLYGDIRTAYQVVDRQGFRMLRDPFTNKPFVQFYATRRVGGGVINFEAVKIGKVAAS